MESVKKWLTERSVKKNGIYVHYSPPRLLDSVPGAQLRQWARFGLARRLERAVLAGQGRRLLSEAEALPLARNLPALVAKCDALHAAVEKGSLLELQELLENEYNRRKYVMCCDEAGVGLLHKAIYYDYTDIAEWLVKNYPELVHQRDSEGRTPLHYTAVCRAGGRAAALLEGAGAARGARDAAGRTPAGYRGAGRTLLALPAPPAMPDNGNPGLVIKRHNIRIWCHDCDMAKLQRVVWEGHGARLLSEVSNQPAVKRFLEAVPYIMNTIREIHSAVAQNDLEGLMKLAGDPVPPQILSSRDAHNMTVMHKAAGLGHGGILGYIADRYPEGINDVDNDGRTPLHYAAAVRDDQHMYNTLVSLGADEGATDNKNKPPGYYINKPQEIDKNLLKTLPDAPRTASNAYPPSWDWKILDTEAIVELNKKSRRKNLKASNENISYKTNSNSVSENKSNRKGGMKGSSTQEFIKDLPDLNEARRKHNGNINNKETEEVEENNDVTEPDDNSQQEDTATQEKKEVPQNIEEDEVAPEIGIHEDSVGENTENKEEAQTEENNDDSDGIENKDNDAPQDPNQDEKIDTHPEQPVAEIKSHNDDNATETNYENEPEEEEDIKTSYDTKSHDNAEHEDEPAVDNNEEDALNDESNGNNNDNIPHEVEIENTTHENENTQSEHENFINKIDNSNHVIDNSATLESDKSIHVIKNDNTTLESDTLNHVIKNTKFEEERDAPTNEGNNNDNSEDDNDVQVPGESQSEYSDIHLRSTAEATNTGSAKRGNETGRNTQESLIEGIISGEAEMDSQDASITQRDVKVEGDILVVENEIDPEVAELIYTANMEMLATLVLNGEGSRLVGRISGNSELQAFLDNVPTYMQKINKVHLAAREGNIKDLQAALDRRKFAIARDPISPNGATPLHVATVFGKTNIMKYLGGRFPETLSAVDFEGRTALHYAAVTPDNGHYYNLLQQLGANAKDLDDSGQSAEDYFNNPNLLPFNQLLGDFGISEEAAHIMLSDKGADLALGLPMTDNRILENIADGKINTANQQRGTSNAAANGHMDIPTFKTEEGRYLAKSLGDPLIKGLTEVANVKPKDPVAFLASFLHNFPEHEKPQLGMEESNVVVTTEAGEVENEQPPSKPVRSAARTAVRPHRPIDVVTVEPQAPEASPDAPEAAFSSANRDEHGQSMLHFASARQHTNNALFQLLQESDISIGYRDELYRTVRDVSIQANIAENTAEIDRYVLHLAARGNTQKIMELLMEGYDHILDVVDEEGMAITEVIAQRGDTEMGALLASIPSFEESRESLHGAARSGDLAAVRAAVSAEGGRTLARARNTFGRTVLHVAVLAQHEDVVAYLAQTCAELLRVGDNLERTPLHYAMGVEKMESLSRLLIRAGAKRVLKDLKGRQPSYYFMNKSDILRLKEEEEVY